MSNERNHRLAQFPGRKGRRALSVSLLLAVFLIFGCLCPGSALSETADAEVNLKAKIVFSAESGFYQEDISLSLQAEGADAIYYTLDCTTPTERSAAYTGPIGLTAGHADLPKCVVVRAVAYYPDGAKSQVFTRSYFMDTEIQSRFTTPVFSIVGDPADLTEGENAILVGDNVYLRGREMERAVSLEVFTQDGENVATQTVGVRVFGNASRSRDVKSLKLYTRKTYDKNNKRISYNFFDTPRERGGYVTNYKKLVLRNTANDFEFAFIRDEFAQYVMRWAGYPVTQGVRPVVVYLNGEYYALNWLHETYNDEYFKEMYGDTAGEYFVVEGEEQNISHTAEGAEDYEPMAAAFLAEYSRLYRLDLTDDANFAQVLAFMDVKNYLDYYAFNIYIANADWPHNNLKIYAYVADDGEYDAQGVRDGRWRWAPHDMDMSFWLYGSNPDVNTKYSYNNLQTILTDTSRDYSPMFAKLMQRPDCRKYFLDKMNQLMEEVFKPEVLLGLLDEVDQMRAEELKYFYIHLEELKQKENSTLWSSYSYVNSRMKTIKEFINERPAYMREFLESELPYLEVPAESMLFAETGASQNGGQTQNGNCCCGCCQGGCCQNCKK